MMTGFGQFGPIEMGGMFSVVKVREGLARERLQGSRLVPASRKALLPTSCRTTSPRRTEAPRAPEAPGKQVKGGPKEIEFKAVKPGRTKGHGAH